MVTLLEDPTKYIQLNSAKIRTIVEDFGYEVIDLVGNMELYKLDKLKGRLYHWDTSFIDIYGTVDEFMSMAEKLEANGFCVTIRY